MSNVIYISGRGGDASRGLGGYIRDNVERYVGVSLSTDFLKADFTNQVDAIQRLINEYSDHDIVANSYGAYLLLHALVDNIPTERNIKLMSPVLGKGISKSMMFSSRPPSVKRLMDSVKEKRLSLSESTFIYIGEQDSGYCPELTQIYADYIGEDHVFILQGEGHSLSKDTVRAILGYEGDK